MTRLFCILATIPLFLIAVSAQTAVETGNDPEAKATLDKVRKKYESLNALTIEFTSSWEVPGQDKNMADKGKITQQKEKYRLELADRTLISDGKNLWVHLKDKNEVQLNSIEDNDSALTPGKLLKIYESKDFAYVLINEYSDKQRIIRQIEFKPLDYEAEYSKIRLEVDKKTSDILNVKTFYKDGSRNTITINKQLNNPTVSNSTFTFRKEDHPGVRVEDLRID